MIVVVAQQLKKEITIQEPSKGIINNNPRYYGYPGDYLVTTGQGNQAIMPKEILEEMIITAGIHQEFESSAPIQLQEMTLYIQ